ncbi:non-specific lipid-transfer protein-like protein [Tanacetum coccineum]
MILVITMAAHYGGVMAQPSGCSNVLISMSQCVDYVTGNTPTSSSGCCTQFASVMQLQPQCWCRVLNGSATFLGIKINEIPDFDLSRACNVQMSPTSQCNGNDFSINKWNSVGSSDY